MKFFDKRATLACMKALLCAAAEFTFHMTYTEKTEKAEAHCFHG